MEFLNVPYSSREQLLESMYLSNWNYTHEINITNDSMKPYSSN
jgi:hypothetical protein